MKNQMTLASLLLMSTLTGGVVMAATTMNADSATNVATAETVDPCVDPKAANYYCLCRIVPNSLAHCKIRQETAPISPTDCQAYCTEAGKSVAYIAVVCPRLGDKVFNACSAASA